MLLLRKVDRPTVGTFDGKLVTHASTLRCKRCQRETKPPVRFGYQAVAFARFRRICRTVLTIRNTTATPISSVERA
jgi:hypothetical protein